MKTYTNFDILYKQMFNDLYNYGRYTTGEVRTKYVDGTPAHYKQLIGYNFRIDNSTDDALLLTTRKCPYKSAIIELYWIWILKSNDVNLLQSLGCKFWNEWKDQNGTIGKAYGYQLDKPTFGHPSQVHYMLNEIKNNPNSRRIITEIWNPEELNQMTLTPCVHLTQWSVIDNDLYLNVRQRSCDFALGLVSNVFQYSILHKLVAMECGLNPKEIIWDIHNLHYYDRHEKDLIKQNDKDTFIQPPKVKIENFNGFWDFKPVQVNVENYNYDKTEYKYEIAV